MNSNLVMESSCVFSGNRYRITVLSDVLIRLEYDINGNFNNYETLNVTNRNFPPIEIKKEETNDTLMLETFFFKLVYKKESEFLGTKLNPSINLGVTIKENNKTWYYTEPEVRNMLGVPTTMEGEVYKTKANNGLYNIEGYAVLDDSNSLILVDNKYCSNKENKVDLYLFVYGKDFLRALTSYYYLTGSQPMLPKYAFGTIWDKHNNYNLDSVKELTENFKNENIPFSSFVLNNYGDITSPFSIKNDSILINNYLVNQKINVIYPINPFKGINQTEKNISIFKNKLNTTAASVIPFNVYDLNFIKAFYESFIETIKTHSVMIENGTSSNVSELILSDSLYKLMKQNNIRPMILSRNMLYKSHTSSISYSNGTLATLESLDHQIYLLSTASNIGKNFISFPTGGYVGGIESSETYIRYIQSSVFSPILRISSKTGLFYRREPWKWDIKTKEISKKYLRLRYKLIPYLYSLNYNLYKYSYNLITPIAHLKPDIVNEPIYKNEYMLGTEMLVSPITNTEEENISRTKHKFYLPEGIWYEFKTGNRYPGDNRYSKLYKLEDYPVFVKAGGIIPLGVIDNNNLNSTNFNKYEIHIFPGKDNIFNLYEDDGITLNYTKGYFILTRISYKVIEGGFTLTLRPIDGKKGIISEFRNYKFVFRNIMDTSDITIDNKNNDVPFNKTYNGLDLILEVNNVCTNLELNITLKNTKEIKNIINPYKELESIISEYNIKTTLKEKIYNIIVNKDIKNKKSEIKKLKKEKLDEKIIKDLENLIKFYGV